MAVFSRSLLAPGWLLNDREPAEGCSIHPRLEGTLRFGIAVCVARFVVEDGHALDGLPESVQG
jgi:hypothetical protein